VLGDGEPKYLNSPETAVFRKGHELYGLFESRQTPGRPREMLVVEGYLDVASLVQHGIEQVVATLGTAATAENVRRLTRLTDRVIFCFDGDRAGRAAAWRALETALPFGGGTVELKFLLLPEGDDPDSFVRAHGAAAFRELAERAEPLADFFVRGLTARVDFGTVDGRARFAAFAKPLLTRLPEGLYRATVIEAMSEKLKLGSAVLEQLLGDAPPGAALGSSPSHAARPAAPERPDRPGGPRRRTAVQKVINLLLHFPGAAARIDATERLERLNQPGAALLRRVVETARALPAPKTALVLERLRDDPDYRFLERIVADEPLDSEAEAAAVLNNAVDHMVQDADRARAVAAVRTHRPEEPPRDSGEERGLPGPPGRDQGPASRRN
jgi:DNA primase